MSTFYYFYNDKEYFELTSGTWFQYMEDLQDTLVECVREKASYSDFVKKLRRNKVFDGLYDIRGNGYITEENERYFLRPLYDWAFEQTNVSLIDEYKLYDEAVRECCKDKGIQYRNERFGTYPREIEKELDGVGAVIKKYLTKVGSIDYESDSSLLNSVGVSFERALAELRKGAVIHRKDDDCSFWMEKGHIVGTFDGVPSVTEGFSYEDVLAKDWEYCDKKESKVIF